MESKEGMSMQISIIDEQMKSLLEEILVKIVQEKREIFYDIVTEALEDVALAHAIQEGRKNQFVSEDRILALLEE